MSEDHVLKPIGESLWVVYKDRGATLEFARLSERGDSLSAEVTVSNASAGTTLHWARVNLASTQGRGALVKAVEEAEPTGDWRPMVERACRLVAQHVRTGEPAIALTPEAPTKDVRWAVEGWVPMGQTTVLFGDGGAGKSFLAMTLGLSGLLDRAITPRWRMTPLRRLLYLDWEADRAEQQARLWRLTQGLGSEPVEGAVLHRTMRRPLRDEIVAIRTEVDRHEVDFVICDSLAPASGPEPEHADAALTTLLALRSLAVTVLCIAHVSKVQADSKAPARPYGCYSEDTEVLTPRGWLRHGDWKDGEAVLAFDLAAGVLRYEVPTQLYRYLHDGPMIHGHTQSTDFLVTPNHRLVIRPGWAAKPKAITRHPRFPRGWQFREAGSLATSQIRVPFSSPVDESAEDRSTITVPGVGDFAADDFLQALGWWVSEGSIDSPNPNGGALQWSQALGSMADVMLETLTRLGWSVHRTLVRPKPDGPRSHERPMQHLRLRGQGRLTCWVREHFGHRSPDKRLGAFIFELSLRQRLVVLQALVDGDGRRWPRGRMEYYTVSRQLADDIQRLAILCGYGSTIRREQPGKVGRYDRYTVKMSPPSRSSIMLGAALRRGLERQDYHGPVYCFTLPSGAYLTRRRGLIAIHGNSVHIQNLARSVIEARGSEADDQEEATVSLYHRKSNQGRRQPPSALRFSFESSGAIRVSSGEPDSGGAGLAYQVLEALKTGPQKSAQLAEQLDATPNQIRAALSRLEKRTSVIRIGEVGRGRGHESQWALTDRKRTEKRTAEEEDRALSGDDDGPVPF